MPELRQKIEEQGAEVVGGSPEAFRKHVEAERAKWSRLIQTNNIVVN
jgi:tripartite-type tricarboxylate transporter receptor subunit TctC